MESIGSQEIRVMIADNQLLFRNAVRKLLDSEPGLHVVGEAGTGPEAVDQAEKLQPDILLIDSSSPHDSGLQTLRQIAGTTRNIRTIVMAITLDRDLLLQAMLHGARGVVLKNTEAGMLFKSIRQVMAGEYWLGHSWISELVSALRSLLERAEDKRGTARYHLTDREISIVSAVVEGLTNKQIAEKYALSEQTVKHHLTNIFNKVGVPNRVELAFFSIRNHLVYDT